MTMVYYGLQLLAPDYFYASSTLMCAVVACGVGNSWTAAGTLGIGLMGTADNMNLSPAITAGAVISGAYFGDKISPLSDTVNLATAAAGANLFEHIRETLWTAVPAFVVALIAFALFGEPGEFECHGETSAHRADFRDLAVAADAARGGVCPGCFALPRL